MKRRWTNEQLITAVNENFTINGVLRTLGLSVSPGNHSTISKWIKKLGIDKSHFTGKAHGTSNPGKLLSEILVIGEYRSTSNLKHRILKERLLENQCQECGICSMWNNKPITLELDHINGNPCDNRLENLRILCPNCHSQTKTFRKKSKETRYIRPTNLCLDCKLPISATSIRCLKCSGIAARNFWPPAIELFNESQQTSYVKVAKRLGVSDSGLRKYLRRELNFLPVRRSGNAPE